MCAKERGGRKRKQAKKKATPKTVFSLRTASHRSLTRFFRDIDMGCASSKVTGKSPTEIERIRRRPIKMILLGYPSAGKSTVMKQFYRQADGLPDDVRLEFKGRIADQASLMLEHLRAVAIQLDLSDEENAVLSATDPREISSSNEYPSILQKLKAFRQESELPFSEPVEYVMNNLARMMEGDYVPTDDDILRVRFKSTEVSSGSFRMDKHEFEVFDISGDARTQADWPRRLSDTGGLYSTGVCVILVVSTVDLDLPADEGVDRGKTRHEASINSARSAFKDRTVFVRDKDRPVALRSLVDNVFIFLNKVDRFDREYDAKKFEAATGIATETADEALKALGDVFAEVCGASRSTVLRTCAISSDKKVKGNMVSVLNSVRAEAIRKSMKRLGIGM
jgi:GTPase SAR1 family protein